MDFKIMVNYRIVEFEKVKNEYLTPIFFVRVTEEENERIEKLAERMQINKSRMIRNIVLGDIGDYEMLANIGVLPIVKKAMAFYDKNFKNEKFDESNEIS